MKRLIILIFTAMSFFTACNEKSPVPAKLHEIQFQNKGHLLVHKMIDKVGNYNDLIAKKDVSYMYTYETANGRMDISNEKYIFDGELSYGAYSTHERSYPYREGLIEQGYDGSEYWLKYDGEIQTNKDDLKRVAFNRPTNFYWFTMFQKLLDPGLIYTYMGEKIINEKDYDIVKVTFESKDDKPKDIYQLYINKKTSLVDQFLFTVADFGKMDIPFLMKLQYEEIDGILIPTARNYKSSTWDAEINKDPWINITWANIKFNNGFSVQDFKK